ncbi:MAG: oligosaccharide flippase family protein [Alphaproteobacteria bacterium]|nr:oligosaccharide flippase family protein [Alphaproteobacteria bacterium]
MTMIVTLFTSREVLRILGETDYGIYNVVGGVIVLFAFFQTALNNASLRFLAYDLGKGDMRQLQKTFSVIMTSHIFLSLIVVVISESIGLWFVNTHLNIPENRSFVVNVVYQFTILSFVINLLRIPYNSLIVAYEKMAFYAYISIIEAILKLIIVYVLLISRFDKLAIYAILLFIVSVVCLVIYYFFCKNNFSVSRYRYYWDKQYLYKILGFSGWSMLGGVANVSAQQGGNFLLNIYSGLSANAALGIANQVSHALYSFASNFQVAFNPQITKLYSCGDNENLFRLIFRSSLVSYYLTLLISLPFFLNSDFILGLWLYEVPLYTAEFCILMTVYQMIDAMQAPINGLIYATGNIKCYNIWLSFFIFLNIPLSWIMLAMGFSPCIVLIIRVLINLITSIIRIHFMKTLIEFPEIQYIKEVCVRILLVTSIALIVSILLKSLFTNAFISVILFSTIILLIVSMIILYWGFGKEDRVLVLNYLKLKILNAK